MAFLLSPKSGGVTYAFTSSDLASINGGEAHIYGTDVEAGTVSPGDVITWDGGSSVQVVYTDASTLTPILEKQETSPYTVEAVDGATGLYLNNREG
jgi:hypothetical protein